MDGGAVWELAADFSFAEMDCAVHVSENVPAMVLWGGGSVNPIYRSYDYGSSWESVMYGNYVNISCFAGHPYETAHLAAGGFTMSSTSQFYHSWDSGATWELAPDILAGAKVKDMVFDTSGRILYATDTGIYRDDPGGGFVKMLDCSANVFCRGPYDLELYAGCDDSAVYLSMDDGETWEDIGGFHRDDIDVLSLELVGFSIFVGTEGFGIFRLPLVSGVESASAGVFSTSSVSVLETPVSGAVTISVPPLASPYSLNVFDVSGRVVHSSALTPSASSYEVVVSDLAPGVYFTGLSEADTYTRFVVIR